MIERYIPQPQGIKPFMYKVDNVTGLQAYF